MTARRRALRRDKRKQAEHDRAVQQIHALRQLAAKTPDHATLYRAVGPFPSSARLAIVEGLRPFLSFDPYAEPGDGKKVAA